MVLTKFLTSILARILSNVVLDEVSVVGFGWFTVLNWKHLFNISLRLFIDGLILLINLLCFLLVLEKHHLDTLFSLLSFLVMLSFKLFPFMFIYYQFHLVLSAFFKSFFLFKQLTHLFPLFILHQFLKYRFRLLGLT